MSWEVNWNLQKNIGTGGQGTVEKVSHKQNNIAGSLKRLHPSDELKTERRGRLAAEIIILKSINLNGIPKIIESNEKDYENPKIPLYMIYEWIEGQTLAQFRQSNKISIDFSILIILKLLNIIECLHDYKIIHRDIKPDNIIIQSCGDLSCEIFLIDFGISWCGSEDPRFLDTRTQQGLGNRFLELPELKPGRNIRDIRSDITYVIGILFYLLFDKYPRQLSDEYQRMPHQSIVTTDYPLLTQDTRWSKLYRIFNIGFHPNIDLRFGNVSELKQLIISINQEDIALDNLEAAKTKLKLLLDSNEAQQIQRQHDAMRIASSDFINLVQAELGSVGLVAGGSGPNIQADQKTCDCTFFAVKQNTSDPKVPFYLRIQLDQFHFYVIWSVNNRPPTTSFKGSTADIDGLKLSCKQAVKDISELIISDYLIVFQSSYQISPSGS